METLTTTEEKAKFMVTAAMVIKGITKEQAIKEVGEYLTKLITENLLSGNSVKQAAEWCILQKQRSVLELL